MVATWSTRMVEPTLKDEINLDSFFEPVVHDDAKFNAVAEQMLAVLQAVPHLVETVGRPEDRVYVSVMGHSNPGHGPQRGHQDEYLTVQITACPGDEHKQAVL